MKVARNRLGLTPTRRRGLTIAELVISMAVISMLMAGMGSAVMIASRAIDDGTSPAARTSSARDALDRITADVNVALNFSERSANVIAFTVPDRDGDAAPERIRYAWSGTEGDPLTLKYNSAAEVTIAENVHHFDLSYLHLTTGLPPPPPEEESAEMILAFHDDAPGGVMQAFRLRSTSWCAQCFFPRLPTNTIGWAITRVKFSAAIAGTVDGKTGVEIRPADEAQKPNSSILDVATISEGDLLASPTWVEIVFGSLNDLDPSTGMCLVLMGVSGPKFTADVTYELGGSPMTPDTHFVSSWDKGVSWSAPEDTQDMRFYIYGTVTTEGPAVWP